MSRFTLRHGIAALFVTLLLLAPWSAQARPLEKADPLAGAIARLTDWFTALFGDYGCMADPNGSCRGAGASTAPADQPDYSCTMDPDGRCRDLSTAADQIDYGCVADPNGRCHGTSAPADQIDTGCWLDPNGGACGNHG